MSKPTIKVWVTKYALTEGIQAVDAEQCDETMIKASDGKYFQYFHGNDWHRTPEAAIARAEEMRKAKLKSLAKSIAKIEAMQFKVVP